MKKDHHQINEEVVDAIGEKNLPALHLTHGNHRFTFGGLMKSATRRKAKELIKNHTLAEVAVLIGKSEKQTERILES